MNNENLKIQAAAAVRDICESIKNEEDVMAVVKVKMEIYFRNSNFYSEDGGYYGEVEWINPNITGEPPMGPIKKWSIMEP